MELMKEQKFGLGCMTIGKDYSDESRTQAIEIIRSTCLSAGCWKM